MHANIDIYRRLPIILALLVMHITMIKVIYNAYIRMCMPKGSPTVTKSCTLFLLKS